MQASELLAQFAVYGRFYERQIAGVDEHLRDRLEIAPHGWPLEDVVQREPDLLVVMMNPGASRPLDALWEQSGTDAPGFVAAQPDRTQYQIMRLLRATQQKAQNGQNWQHARILNLSDLRTPKSAIFIDKLQKYASDDSHSLFSDARREQAEKLLANRATPVLCAWGLSPHFVGLAQRALRSVAGHPLLGLTNDGVLYRHPLPQRHDLQLQWLADISQQVGV